jgi:glycosyltransferase involved in cell wall biosynthesis
MTERRAERVAVVTSSYPGHADDPSGHFVATDVAHLRHSGRDVVVVSPDLSRPRLGISSSRRTHAWAVGGAGERIAWLPSGDAFGWPGALERLRERPERFLGVLAFVRAARSVLRASGPWDRVIAHFLVPCAWPVLDGLTSQARRFEAVIHGSDVRLVRRLPPPLRRRIASTLAPFELRCVSHELRAELEAALGATLASRARVEPAPLDTIAPRCRAELRSALGIARDARLLVVSGRLVRSKQVDVALRAARLVPNALVVVVGDGPERSRLEHAFPEVHFTGLVGRARALDWLAAADALVVASREEGAPSVVREARALGTPVVALACGDLRAWRAADPGLLVVPTATP